MHRVNSDLVTKTTTSVNVVDAWCQVVNTDFVTKTTTSVNVVDAWRQQWLSDKDNDISDVDDGFDFYDNKDLTTMNKAL